MQTFFEWLASTSIPEFKIDNSLRSTLSSQGEGFITNLFFSKKLNDYIEKGFLSKNILELLTDPNFDCLHRGTNLSNLPLIQRYGNDKNISNSHPDEIDYLNKKGLKPQDIIWAAINSSKAMEFVAKTSAALYLIYDKNFFQQIDTYLWKLTHGSFLDALQKVSIIHFGDYSIAKAA